MINVPSEVDWYMIYVLIRLAVVYDLCGHGTN